MSYFQKTDFCPFCGSKELEITVINPRHSFVSCLNCDAIGPASPKPEIAVVMFRVPAQVSMEQASTIIELSKQMVKLELMLMT